VSAPEVLSLNFDSKVSSFCSALSNKNKTIYSYFDFALSVKLTH
jgi:hypothetical protein